MASTTRPQLAGLLPTAGGGSLLHFLGPCSAGVVQASSWPPPRCSRRAIHESALFQGGRRRPWPARAGALGARYPHDWRGPLAAFPGRWKRLVSPGGRHSPRHWHQLEEILLRRAAPQAERCLADLPTPSTIVCFTPLLGMAGRIGTLRGAIAVSASSAVRGLMVFCADDCHGQPCWITVMQTRSDGREALISMHSVCAH